MNTSAIFEYAYRNPESDIAQELFSIQNDLDYDLEYDNFSEYEDYNFGYPDGETRTLQEGRDFLKKIKQELAATRSDRASNTRDAVLKARVANITGSLTEINNRVAKLEQERTAALANPGSRKAINAQYDKLIHQYDSYKKGLEKQLEKAKAAEIDYVSRAELIGEAQKTFTGGTKWYGKHIGSRIKSASSGLSSKLGIKDRLRDVSADTTGKGALIGAGVAAGIGTGAAIGRHVYLKHRMKQTGAKSKRDVKKIIRERAATKSLMKAKGADKGSIKAALKKQYGY